MATANDTGTTLSAAQLAAIRKALMIGLMCYGELEEKINAAELAEISGTPWPEGAKPLHPTGSADVASTFADALAYAGAGR